MRSFRVPLLLLLLSASVSASPDDRRNYAAHVAGNLTSGWAWPAVGVAAGTTLGSLALYEWVDPRIDPSGDRKLGSASTLLSEIGVYAPFSAPLLFLGVGWFFPQGDPKRDSLFLTAEELVETMALSATTAFALKFSVRRDRPDHADTRSFPSAHAAFSFATAGVLFHRYPWYVGVPSLAAASLVGYSRIDLDRHHPSDVLAGAGIGFLFATLVHAYHSRFEDRPPPLLPLAGEGTLGLAWNSTF